MLLNLISVLLTLVTIIMGHVEPSREKNRQTGIKDNNAVTEQFGRFLSYLIVIILLKVYVAQKQLSKTTAWMI